LEVLPFDVLPASACFSEITEILIRPLPTRHLPGDQEEPPAPA
jgi:hypothetical protein